MLDFLVFDAEHGKSPQVQSKSLVRVPITKKTSLARLTRMLTINYYVRNHILRNNIRQMPY